jgi:hypothetical protein
MRRKSRLNWAMSGLAVALLSTGLLAVWSGGAERLPYRDPPGFLLPDVTGLVGEDSAGPVPSGTFGRTTRYLTVNIDADGRAYLADDELRTAKPWRGVNLPVDTGPVSISVPVRQCEEIMVHVGAGESRFRIRNWRSDSTADLIDRLDKLGQIGPSYFGYTINAAPSAPFDWVADAIAAVERAGFNVEFRPLPQISDGWHDTAGYRIPEAGRWDFDRLRRRLGEEALLHPGVGRQRELSGLGVLIRADARAPWSSVMEVITACMNARVWRISFAAREEGQEVVLGRVTRRPSATRCFEYVDPPGGDEAIADIPVGPPPTPPGFKVAPPPPDR